MAGDLKNTEYLTILDRRAERAAADAAQLAHVHRYGRVVIGQEPPCGALATRAQQVDAESVSSTTLLSLNETERLGLEAFRHRLSPEYGNAKARRPREGAEWNMMGCTNVGSPGAMRALG